MGSSGRGGGLRSVALLPLPITDQVYDISPVPSFAVLELLKLSEGYYNGMEPAQTTLKTLTPCSYHSLIRVNCGTLYTLRSSSTGSVPKHDRLLAYFNSVTTCSVGDESLQSFISVLPSFLSVKMQLHLASGCLLRSVLSSHG